MGIDKSHALYVAELYHRFGQLPPNQRAKVFRDVVERFSPGLATRIFVRSGVAESIVNAMIVYLDAEYLEARIDEESPGPLQLREILPGRCIQCNHLDNSGHWGDDRCVCCRRVIPRTTPTTTEAGR